MAEMHFCRACKSERLYMFLHLGIHPPANQFLTAAELCAPEPAFPLDCYACVDCGLIQVPNQITTDFFRHYLYVPSGAAMMRDHFENLAENLVSRYMLSRNDLIVDVGSNEGLFLLSCRARGIRSVGVEPAENLAKIASDQRLDVFNDYFTPQSARELCQRYGRASVIVTTNTFNHIGDLDRFMEGITTLLADNGTFVIEVPHSLALIQKNEFDTIYHEHVSEFSVKSLVKLLRAFDMQVCDIERLDIHGGSMRVHGRKLAAANVSPAVEEWLMQERRAGLFSKETYDAFRRRVERNRERLMALLSSLKGKGKRLAGYGAPAKGNTLLNYCGIGTDFLEFLADRNALKHGLYSPGMHIPITSPEAILRERPDYVLVLAWNFFDEIVRQQEEYRRCGGKFILPIPEPIIVQ